MKILVTDREGKSHAVEGTPDQSLMKVLRDKDFVEAACNGQALCGACHFFVDAVFFAKLPAPSGDETGQLHQCRCFREGSSRLSCQIPCAEALNGIRVVLAPYD